MIFPRSASGSNDHFVVVGGGGVPSLVQFDRRPLLLNRGEIYRMALEICRNLHTFMYFLATILTCSGLYSGQRVLDLVFFERFFEFFERFSFSNFSKNGPRKIRKKIT
jgi:hypothetical protein